MFQQFYEELRSIPVPQTHEEHLQLLSRTFCRLLDTIRLAECINHPQINALAALLYEQVIQDVVLVALGRQDLPRISFSVFQQPDESPFPLIMLPETYLAQVREDPLHELVGIVGIATNVRDYCCQVLALSATRMRAHTFQAELLLCVQQQHEQEGLAFTPNAYQQQVLKQFPCGLDSLSPALAYPTSDPLILKRLP